MTSDFPKAFDLVVGLEGGYTNDPRDRGGETKYGISKRAYPDLDIPNLTVDQAKAIYRRDYWDACKCDQLPAPLDIFVFDAAVNQGVGTAVKTLQRLIGVPVDGIIGPVTLGTASKMKREMAMLYMADRALQYTDMDQFGLYGRGWLKRLFTIAREA